MTDRIRTSVIPLLHRVLLLALAATPLGCGLFKPDKGGPPPPPPFQYPDLSTPQHVIENLKYSFQLRDSVRTSLIYDDTYQGTSVDNSDNTNLTFTKTQEVQSVWLMGKSQDITRVSFEYKPESTWIRLNYPTDPAGWTALQLQGVNIQVDDAVHGTQIANSSNFFEFRFIPTLDTASPTDTTWKIVRWTEVRN